MDIKRLVTALSTGLALILLYYAVVLPQIDRRWGVPQQPSGGVAQTQPSESSTTEASSLPTTQSTTQPAVASTVLAAPGAGRVVPATQPSSGPVASALGSDQFKDSQFALQINVQSLGAGLDSVILNSFNKTARGKERYVFQKPLDNRLDTAPLGSKSITVNGSTYDLAGVQWSLISATAMRVIYGADLVQKGDTLLRLTKTYEVFPRSNANEGYEIHVAYGFENTSGSLETISSEFNGPTLPPPETNRPPDRQAVGGYIVDKDVIAVDDHPIEAFKPSKDNGEVDLTKDSKGHLARWAGAISNYFAAVVLPQDMLIDGKPTNPNYVASIVAHGVNIDKDTPPDDHQAYVTFKTTDIKLAAGQSAVIPLTVYFGPKWRDVLDAAHYTGYPRHYDLLDIIRTSECGLSFCSIQWLNDGIGWLLRLMHAVFRDWGMAIIGLVAIVRVILHPITRQSQISMARMGKMGPEMERLKKKYGDDKDALNKAMVEFHREQGLGPYLGCLPMFLQMPIWIALYGVLESTFELRQAPFLGHLTWIHDLAQPDRLFAFSHPVKIVFFTITGFNLLPLLLSAAMLAQQQFMPKPVAASADQMKQQKMMQMLSPVMFLFFFYSLPSGLNLYIFTSTAVGVIESKLIRDHLKQKEEAEKAGRVLIETKATRGNKQARLNQAEAPKKKSPMRWLGGQWASLLERAEQFRQEQDKGKKGKKK